MGDHDVRSEIRSLRYIVERIEASLADLGTFVRNLEAKLEQRTGGAGC